MTMPVEPATGTPAPATGDPSQQPTAPNTDPGQEPATGTDDWATTFDGMTPTEVRRALDNSRKWENRAKSNKAKLDEALAQTQPTEGTEDWQARAQTAEERAEAAEGRAVELAYKDTVRGVAADVGADASALLDSQSFRDAVADELDGDFDDDDLKAAVEKIAGKYAKESRFSAAPAGPTRSGADITGGPAGLRQITESELANMTPEQIVAAQENGQLNSLLGRA